VNHRADIYGGSIENRARLLMEVIDEVIEILTPEKVGVKITPNTNFMDISDSNPLPLFIYVVKELNKRNIAFMEVGEYFSFDGENPRKRQEFF
jgi:2,4-dienoyl-CoA reductase-like NADH-dependent reductase (Old Yellow Enzyme family)